VKRQRDRCLLAASRMFVILVMVMPATALWCSGCGGHTTMRDARDWTAAQQRKWKKLPEDPVAQLVTGMPGVADRPQHHFTIASTGHEYMGATFSSKAGPAFAVMLRDREVIWIARRPPWKEIRFEDQELADAQAVERWFVGYAGPTVSPDEVKAICERRLEQAVSQEVNPLIHFLNQIGPDTEVRKHDRVRRASERLNPWRLRIGTPADEIQALLPRPVKVDTGDGGGVEYTFGEDLDGGWHCAPEMVVTVEEGHVVRVLTVYLVAEYWRNKLPGR
jgi:hypothetical protein